MNIEDTITFYMTPLAYECDDQRKLENGKCVCKNHLKTARDGKCVKTCPSGD